MMRRYKMPDQQVDLTLFACPIFNADYILDSFSFQLLLTMRHASFLKSFNELKVFLTGCSCKRRYSHLLRNIKILKTEYLV